MASIHFTDRDRDDKGFIKAPAGPRSLADLLPKPDEIRTDATRRPKRDTYATLAIIAVGAAFVLVYGWQTPQALPSPPQPRTAPMATFQPTSAPTSAPAAAGRLLIAFAAPDGQLLGAIESTRAITPTAHYGDSWTQAQVAGSGLIWLRAADLPGMALIGPDLAPPTPRPAPAYVYSPTAPPAPPPCAEAGTPGKIVRVCDYAELSELEARAKQQWLEQFGGNIGVIGTPSPQPWEQTP